MHAVPNKAHNYITTKQGLSCNEQEQHMYIAGLAEANFHWLG